MEDKLKTIKNWENNISLFKKLKFEDAKKIYQIMQKEENKENVKLLRNKLINGTLHAVLNFVKNNGFIYINNSFYNIEDIITCSCEIFMSKIDSGILMEASAYKDIFNLKFYSEILESLGIDKLRFQEEVMLNIDVFVEIMDWFIKNNNNHEIKYNEFLKYILEKHNHLNYLLDRENREQQLRNSYDFLKCIYNSLDENTQLTKSKSKKLKYLLINSGYEYMEHNLEQVIINDITNKIIDKIYLNKIMKIIFDSAILTEREKSIIKKRFGIDGYNKCSYEEISLEEKVTRERIRQIEIKSLRKLRRNSELNNLYKFKGENI